MTAKERLEYFKRIAIIKATLIVYLTKDETGIVKCTTRPMVLTDEHDEHNLAILEKIMSDSNFVGFGDEEHVKQTLEKVKWSNSVKMNEIHEDLKLLRQQIESNDI